MEHQPKLLMIGEVAALKMRVWNTLSYVMDIAAWRMTVAYLVMRVLAQEKNVTAWMMREALAMKV